MKILFVNDYKDVVGGTEKYINVLREYLIKEGHEVYLFTSSKNNITYKHGWFKNLILLFNIRTLIEFIIYIQHIKPDIIHAHGFFNELSPSFLLGVHNIPVIMTVHNLQLLIPVSNQNVRTGKKCINNICTGCLNCIGFKGLIYEQIRRIVHNYLLKKIKLYICPSKYYKKILDTYSGYSVIHQLYNGFELNNPYEIVNFNKLLYVGRLVREKGVYDLIGIVNNLRKYKNNFILTIIGDGPEKPKIEYLIQKYRLQKQIKILNKISNDLIYKYYKENTIIIVPSLDNENLPSVCIEAMSIGRPIVGSDTGGIPELIKNGFNGYLVESGNINEFTKKILFLLNNKKQIKIFCKNAAQYSTKFDIKNHLVELSLIYNKLLLQL